MRGGLDDALSKLARRDELRRRAAGEGTSTPPAVTELVEAIAGVISRNPQLGVTVGVEGAGDPMLLHFGFADGVVQVSADTTVAARVAEPPTTHADFEIDVEDDVPVHVAEPPRASHDDQDRFGPTDFEPGTFEPRAFEPRSFEPDNFEPDNFEPGAFESGSFEPGAFEGSEPPTAERPFVAPARQPGETSRDDLAARMQQSRAAAAGPEHVSPAPHPFAATPPPPVPPQAPPPFAATPYPYETGPLPDHAERPYSTASTFGSGFTTPHAEPQPTEQPFSAPPYTEQAYAGARYADPRDAEPHYAEPHYAEPQASQPGFPEPLAEPIPLKVERPEETEVAVRRLAALLRDDPTLLDAPHD